MKVSYLSLTFFLLQQMACVKRIQPVSEVKSSGVERITLCTDSEIEVMNKKLKESTAGYQQTCLTYTDKQGDINLAHVLAATPLGMLAKVFSKVIKRPMNEPSNSSFAKRWDFRVLMQPPFDLNNVLTTPPQFIPNAGQKHQLTAPGYRQFESMNVGKVITGRKLPVEPSRFLKLFAALVSKTKIAPFIGPIHSYSVSETDLQTYVVKDGSQFQGGQFLGTTRETVIESIQTKTISKLFTALALGQTSRFLFTGGERPVLEFLASRPEGSVQFHELLEFSYRMHKGDVYLTLLTLENVLGRWWRFPERENLMSTRKLANFTNAYRGRGDKYGAWYHFFGISLLGLVEKEFAILAGDMESLGSIFLNEMNGSKEDEFQENALNSAGSVFGLRLGELVRGLDGQTPSERVSSIASKFLVQTETEISHAINPDNYMSLDEDFRGRMEMRLSPDLRVVATREGLSVSYLSGALNNCDVEVFPVTKSTALRDSQFVRRFKSNLSSSSVLYPVSTWPEGSVSLAGSRVIVSGCGLGENVLVAESPR